MSFFINFNIKIKIDIKILLLVFDNAVHDASYH